MAFADAYRGRRVLITGHSGFKGSWLSEWLLKLGADVTGFALRPPTSPALFDQLGLASRLRHVIGDVRDLPSVRKVVAEAKPDFIFHLAAQPIVRLSYIEPVLTYATNVLGTVNVLEAVRLSERRCTVVVISTDKCYENREWVHSYREEDPMGGHDPYSSSKAAAEIAIAAYRFSFFAASDSLVRLASARAGNAIGGGDWAADRIVPDCIRALQRDEAISVRNRTATRPWQHVLEPLGGYLWLAARLASFTHNCERQTMCSPFNFGPALSANRSVGELVEAVLRHWPGRAQDCAMTNAVHEATLLNLSTDKAFHVLGWHAVWDFERTVAQTISWYREVAARPAAALECTQRQIAEYETDARGCDVGWAISETALGLVPRSQSKNPIHIQDF